MQHFQSAVGPGRARASSFESGIFCSAVTASTVPIAPRAVQAAGSLILARAGTASVAPRRPSAPITSERNPSVDFSVSGAGPHWPPVGKTHQRIHREKSDFRVIGDFFQRGNTGRRADDLQPAADRILGAGRNILAFQSALTCFSKSARFWSVRFPDGNALRMPHQGHPAVAVVVTRRDRPSALRPQRRRGRPG